MSSPAYRENAATSGLDDASDSYVVKDPARGEEQTLVRSEALERARRAHGTDEDLIVVSLYTADEAPRAPSEPGPPTMGGAGSAAAGGGAPLNKIAAVMAAVAASESPVLG